MTTAPFGFLRVAAAAPRVHVADPEANAGFTLGVFEAARRQGAQVVVFPELGLSGYTSGDLFFNLRSLVGGSESALARILEATRESPMVLALGLPVHADGQLFNAAALVQGGRVRGVVPKSFIPGYKEYYEERWFSAARDALSDTVSLAGQRAPFGIDLLFDVAGEPGLTLAAEVCEDLWVPVPPSSYHAVAGATVILNLSASNDVVGKADYRRQLVQVQSARTLAGYAYAGCGVHESTTDVVFSGHLLVAENGTLLAEGERFRRDDVLVVTDVDVERLMVERARQNSFADTAHQIQRSYRRVGLDPIPGDAGRRLVRRIEPHPFVPNDPRTRDARCEEVFQVQTAGLAKRLEHTGLRRVVLGLSGGLDSTLAFLVCVRTFDLLGLPRPGILAVTLPGPGTTGATRDNARRLACSLGAELREIDIRAACEQHIRDIGLDPGDTGSATYQNLQARERTQVLMDLANKEGGIVVGTGDLSELALGFCTFGGDHIAMYNVNATIPKTLVRHLVSWVASHHATGAAREVLEAIVRTPVSPELVPPAPDGAPSQRTEEMIGPYELHDFFLWATLRLGAGPRKILYLAREAFGERYPEPELRRWLRVFVERFFSQQFKRSVLPDGPKVGSVSLSPRGDWRMPSDASAAAWLRELEG
ncbi:MAG TPA: NAD(+) synthase [Vicinamibacteria bacterium]|nr:NAD(+) synthase [Vicinamibacteria bacterium]